MPEFHHSFTVDAPLAAVRAFHHDTRALRHLTPLPIVARIHHFEPLADGSLAEFTLWFGPLPLRWRAVHSEVGPQGFTDAQVSGPLRAWRHSHRFTAVSPERTRVDDHVVFEHHAGPRGLLTRLLFNRPGLLYLFTARKLLTRRGVARLLAAGGPAA
jgi:ligand-binding SRPBCC domain-containing protein